MIGYYCAACTFYYREIELLTGKRCPECKEPCKPRLILAGQVIGKEDSCGDRASD
jgi:predicted Zn-ribbon and HTH transcriptional regulator